MRLSIISFDPVCCLCRLRRSVDNRAKIARSKVAPSPHHSIPGTARQHSSHCNAERHTRRKDCRVDIYVYVARRSGKRAVCIKSSLNCACVGTVWCVYVGTPSPQRPGAENRSLEGQIASMILHVYAAIPPPVPSSSTSALARAAAVC
ncbi:hypothetical protein EJ05DRAFT_15360 [Pseudovirgaria hyperparasitica]|uniref:Uncharacterized protein n=1 Tax=Pseudovirgaria hyperparasitica TaxID=470096 RepID=A0A6A6WKQ5_9PEZI|nr:uncharacterized protein EJ05DRAFT_15360 [Pseudovirgaria hyperparasitica]KAF2762784.1 hypothetical protein EJ05DRAFT_15360 [Pseudovirgaria hyperparasitica]